MLIAFKNDSKHFLVHLSFKQILNFIKQLKIKRFVIKKLLENILKSDQPKC